MNERIVNQIQHKKSIWDPLRGIVANVLDIIISKFELQV